MTEHDLKVTVDLGMCIRSHSCIRMVPGVFQVGDTGETVVNFAGDVDTNAVVTAAGDCPNFAITVTDGDEVLYDPDQQ
jgi:ferredoxin